MATNPYNPALRRGCFCRGRKGTGQRPIYDVRNGRGVVAGMTAKDPLQRGSLAKNTQKNQINLIFFSKVLYIPNFCCTFAPST